MAEDGYGTGTVPVRYWYVPNRAGGHWGGAALGARLALAPIIQSSAIYWGQLGDGGLLIGFCSCS